MKNLRTALISAAFAATFTLTACGDDSSSSASAEPVIDDDPELVSSSSEDDVESSSQSKVGSSTSKKDAESSSSVAESSADEDESSSSAEESSSSAAKCGDEVYDPATHFCFEDKLYELCGDKSYDPAKEFCSDKEVYELCGGETYATATQYCKDDVITDKRVCGEAYYNPEIQYCKDAATVTDYGSLTYEGQTYKTLVIGNQTWMAENLNYEYNEGTAVSYCYDNAPSNCETYGRLYTWAAAMDSAAVLSETTKGCGMNVECVAAQTPDPIRGVCPEGWHLPNNDEWITVVTAVEKNANADFETSATEFMSVSGWYGDFKGKDSHGFGVLPAGAHIGSGFMDLTKTAGFWTTSEGGGVLTQKADAISWSFSYDKSEIFNYGFEKYDAFSVRCVMDDN